MGSPKSAVRGLELFVRLIKDGCQWHGDIVSRRWAEVLLQPESAAQQEQVKLTLANYEAETDYHIGRDGSIWIA